MLKYSDRVKISSFSSVSKYSEHYIVITGTTGSDDTALQIMNHDLEIAIRSLGLTSENLVFSRLYTSDIANQKIFFDNSELKESLSHGSYSLVQQRSICGSKFILLLYCLSPLSSNAKKVLSSDSMSSCEITGVHYSLHHNYGLTSNVGDSYDQTDSIFKEYNSYINSHGLILLKHSIRTWIYVRDIDNNYLGMVDARKKYFEEQGLNSDTRYIASTGIEAKMWDHNSLVSMDAHTVSNLSKDQIVRMEAPNHMSPTIDYGVTFERGTEVAFGDRSHFHVSGTASINTSGEVLHLGDPIKQTERAIQNILSLIHNSGCTVEDFMYVIVYLRNPNSVHSVKSVIQNYFKQDLPIIYVEGAVCRPDWLVEIEGVLIAERKNDKFKPLC